MKAGRAGKESVRGHGGLRMASSAFCTWRWPLEEGRLFSESDFPQFCTVFQFIKCWEMKTIRMKLKQVWDSI